LVLGEHHGKLGVEAEGGPIDATPYAQCSARFQAWPSPPIVGSGGVQNLELDVSRKALHFAQHLVIRPQSGPTFALGGYREQITQDDGAAGRAKRRFQHVGIGKIPSLGSEGCCRPDAKAAADFRVEQRAKY
jgi:hypothetical protein